MHSEWLEKVVSKFDNSPLDTTPERIKANRGYGTVVLGGETGPKGCKMKTVVINGTGDLLLTTKKAIDDVNIPSQKAKVQEIITLFNEWYHYFDKGYKAPHSIDELPDLIKQKSLEVLTA